MNVAQLRQALAGMPDHWPVHVEAPASIEGARQGVPRGDDGFGDVDYFYTLECVPSAFRSQGNMAVIRLNLSPN